MQLESEVSLRLSKSGVLRNSMLTFWTQCYVRTERLSKKSTNKSKWKQCKSKLNTMEYLRCLLYLGVCTKGYLTGNILHNGVTTDRFISCICYLFKVTPESTNEKVKV